jgi:hypothetical protein
MRWTTLTSGVLLLSALLLFGYSTVEAQSVLPDPGALKQMSDLAPGSTLLFKVTGKTSGGSLWGTDYYTTDSALAMAAVHAGAIRNGQTGVIKVTIYPGRSEYTASTRYGVTSSSWGSFDLSFTVEAAEGVQAPATSAVLPNPGTLKAVPNASPGNVMLFEVTGALTGGSVWGSKTYTTDSDLAMAAVHAGVLRPGQTGVVKVTFYPGQNKYLGSFKNGVKSSNWGSFDLSFMIERVK